MSASASSRGLAALALVALLGSAGPIGLSEDSKIPEPQAKASNHLGPKVSEGSSGPARFVKAIYEGFDVAAAMKTATFVDGFYRAPGNPGYDACLDHVQKHLEAAGFGEKKGFEIEFIETRMLTPAWTPVSGKIEVLHRDASSTTLHAFDQAGDVDRVILPINAPSADVEGPIVFEEKLLKPGSIYVSASNVGSRQIAQLAKTGAVAVISSGIASFTKDPTGGDEHLDAIQFRSVSKNVRLPVAQISPRSYSRLRKLVEEKPGSKLRFEAKVAWREGSLRTLVARILGHERSGEAIAIASHVQEPGAGDNASGVSGLCHAAVSLARAMAAGEIERPARTLEFIWGDEMRQSSIWLEDTKRRVIAGISADMLGQAKDKTGAVCLLEREPDPGALDTLPPDKHTPWGAGSVKEDDLRPSGLSLIARTALHDVSEHVGGWSTSENPWEGGSDHDVFLDRKFPGILIWHFTDFTYHTSLDRIDRLDGEELRRSATAILCTALSVADLRRADVPRLEASNALELELRIGSALASKRPDVAKRWREWCHGVNSWIAAHCVDPEQDE